MSTATTQIIISGKDQLSGAVADAGRRLGTEMEGMRRHAVAVSNVFSSLAGVIGGISVAQLAREIFQAGVAMDALQRSFVAISGSQAMAASEMGFLREEAERLGQSFYDLAPQYKQLAAAARGTALEGEQARKIFSSITGAAAALGLGAAETGGALNALSQMISKGNVQAEELRGQLGERLPGAFSLAAKAMGVSTQELNKMLDNGQVLAVDLLPKLAAELERVYGVAAQTAALESAQAAVNRMSEEWTDLKTNMFHSETAVAGVNMVTQALAGMNAMISQVQQGKAQWIWEGLKMEPMDPSTYRGKVNREMVMPPYTGKPTTPDGGGGGLTASELAKIEAAEKKVRTQIAELTMQEADLAKFKISEEYNELAKALGGATPQLQKWLELKEREAKFIALAKLEPYQVTQLEKMNKGDMFFGQADAAKRAAEMIKTQSQENLQLQTEFAEKYREVILGETEFKIDQIKLQGEAYLKAGAEEVAVAQWVEAEKLKVSREWSDGVQRGLAEYADGAMNAAALAEDAIINGFKGMEDALVEFVKTGKFEFSDFADSVISDMARIAIQQSITGPLASGLGSMIGGLFGGSSPSVASVGAPKVGYAKGGIPGAPSLSAYANTIVDSPTIFPFARGVGLMGEDGPEAIVPLERMNSGKLGVNFSGGGSKVVVNIIESPGSGGRQEQRNEGGVNVIDVFVERIKSEVASDISSGRGSIPAALSRTYGVSRAQGALR